MSISVKINNYLIIILLWIFIEPAVSKLSRLVMGLWATRDHELTRTHPNFGQLYLFRTRSQRAALQLQ